MQPSSFRTGFVSIVGRPNVGKSTLLNHLVGQKISITSSKAQTTRHRITGVRTDAASQFIFVDTPGFQVEHLNALNRAMNRTVQQTLADVDAILFVIEALHFDARDEKVLTLLPAGRPVFLVINKIDRVKDKERLLPFIEQVAGRFAYTGVVPISARHDRQLADLLDAVRPCLPEAPPCYDADDLTDRPERFLAAEIVREKIFRLLGDEVPYSVAVEIELFRMEGTLRRIHAAVIVEREGQKAMLIGARGEKMKKISTQARLDMEKLFDGKVYLEVWVKVKNGWADDVRALNSLGYTGD